MALQRLLTMVSSSGADLSQVSQLEGERGLDYISVQMSNSEPPKAIEYRLDGKFFRVIKRSWT
jgi:hypothetical protein